LALPFALSQTAWYARERKILQHFSAAFLAMQRSLRLTACKFTSSSVNAKGPREAAAFKRGEGLPNGEFIRNQKRARDATSGTYPDLNTAAGDCLYFQKIRWVRRSRLSLNLESASSLTLNSARPAQCES